jgi:hypothetical protein
MDRSAGPGGSERGGFAGAATPSTLRRSRRAHRAGLISDPRRCAAIGERIPSLPQELGFLMSPLATWSSSSAGQVSGLVTVRNRPRRYATATLFSNSNIPRQSRAPTCTRACMDKWGRAGE